MSLQSASEKLTSPFALQLPSQDYGKLQELAASTESTVRAQAEIAIAKFAVNYDGSPLTFIAIADSGGVRRTLVQPGITDIEQLSQVPSADNPEECLRLGAAFRSAVRHYLETNEG